MLTGVIDSISLRSVLVILQASFDRWRQVNWSRVTHFLAKVFKTSSADTISLFHFPTIFGGKKSLCSFDAEICNRAEIPCAENLLLMNHMIVWTVSTISAV